MASREMDIQKRKEKTANNKTSKKKSNWIETILPVLVFAFTLVFFLNFSGVIDLPFLHFMRLPSVEKEDSENLMVKEVEKETESQVVYPGPTLERVEPEESPVIEEPLEEEVEVLSEIEEPSSGKTDGEDVDSSAREERIFRLANIYTAMEPEEASRIMEKLSDEEVVEILSVMKERDVAEILNAFPVERAAEIIKKMMEGR